MVLRVSEAFNLLFKPVAEERAAKSGWPDYDDRRWFRRPPVPNLSEDLEARADLDAKEGELVLMQRIQEALPGWRKRWKETIATTTERISATRPTLRAKLGGALDERRHLPPRSPYDVFAIAAYLIDAAGVYHHIQPEKLDVSSGPCAFPADPHASESPRHLAITSEERQLVRRAARAWREIPRSLLGGSAMGLARHLTSDPIWADLEPLFESWVLVFHAYAEAEVFVRLSSSQERSEPHPGWWPHAYRLLAIADEAARDTAFNFDAAHLTDEYADGNPLQWFEAEFFVEFALGVSQQTADAGERMANIHSLSVARREIIGVLPKVRTPAVGCTLRSLSHHLAITPGQGVARGRWTPSFERDLKRSGQVASGQMNILLVPFPFTVEAQAFCGSHQEDRTSPSADDDPQSTVRYGYFDLHQHWLKPPDGWTQAGPWIDQIVDFLDNLIAAARAHCPAIHAVVFPELSLDHQVFEVIQNRLESSHDDIELLVAGISTKPYRGASPPVEATATAPVRNGNFVAVSSFNRGTGVEKRRVSIREKHHRWKLDRAQIRDYGLLGVLSPELEWWENIALQSRRVDFTVIRDRAVLSAMICEDLARVDPCQQLIRSVGPNLVIALLMDAPQKSGRWPGRYATVLAEDPGCSVLTVTSRGLMARQDRLGVYPSAGSDRIVALWRDDKSGGSLELNCPYDAQGLLLTLIEEQAEDVSLDGRVDKSAIALRYAGHTPVRLPEGAKAHRHVLGAEQKAC